MSDFHVSDFDSDDIKYGSGIDILPEKLGVIAGYPDYPDNITEDDADTLVPDHKGWDSAIDDADDGEMIFVTEDVEADGPTLDADDVVIGSDRYVDGSDGATVKVENLDTPFLKTDGVSGLRMIGLQLEGPNWDPWSTERIEGDAGACGLYLRNGTEDVQVKNCEIYGLSWACVLNYRTDGRIKVYNSYIHHCPRKGTGYGTAFNNGEENGIYDSLILYCRHGVKGSHGDYEVVNCIIGLGTNHLTDVHAPAEGSYLYDRVSFLTSDVIDDVGGRSQPAINIRDNNATIRVRNCQFDQDDYQKAIWLERDNSGDYDDLDDDRWDFQMENCTLDSEHEDGVGANPNGMSGEGPEPEPPDETDDTDDSSESYRVDVETEGSAIGYEFAVNEYVEPVEGTTGSSTGDSVAEDNKSVAGGINANDHFDAYHVTGDIIDFAPVEHDDLTVLIEGEEIDPVDLFADDDTDEGTEDGEDDDEDDGNDIPDSPDYGDPSSTRRFYVYGDDWKGDNAEPIYYTVAIDGEIRLDEKADEFENVDQYGDAMVVTGSVPANSDDAFELEGTVRWVHGDQDRLNFQLNRVQYEPSFRDTDPRDGSVSPDPDENGGSDDSDDSDDSDGSSEPGGSGDTDDGESDELFGPDPDLAEQYDHYIEINGDDYNEEVNYHLVTTDEIVPASTGDAVDNRGWFGHADGRVKGYRDGFYFDNSLLNVMVSPSVGEIRRSEGDGSIDVEDLPYDVLVDGEPIDHDRFDPRTSDAGTPLDLSMGYDTSGVADELSPTVDDADHVVRSESDLDDAFDSLSDGDVLVVDDTVEFSGGDGTLYSSDADALTIACTDDGHLQRTNTPNSHWSNFSFRFGGDYLSTVNLSLQGSFNEPQGYDSGGCFAFTTDGAYPTHLNAHIRYFGVVGFDCRGYGETFLCIDGHHIQIGGSGYAIGTSGEATLEGDDPDEYNWIQPWHKRTSIKFGRFNACRHNLERAKNVACEARWYVLGDESRHGGDLDDSHRFSRGEDVRSDRVLMKPNPSVVGDEVRGRPRLCRWSRTWYEGWDDDWQDQLDPEKARRTTGRDTEDEQPFGQRCATDPHYKDRTHGWDSSDGPLIPHPTEDNDSENEEADADPLAWQFDQETIQVGGSRPSFISDAVYSAVEHFRRI